MTDQRKTGTIVRLFPTADAPAVPVPAGGNGSDSPLNASLNVKEL